jgi:hypothetical protein
MLIQRSWKRKSRDSLHGEESDMGLTPASQEGERPSDKEETLMSTLLGHLLPGSRTPLIDTIENEHTTKEHSRNHRFVLSMIIDACLAA